ncbi:hypothetical protein UFOVP1040_36 [uncultured Caudovirales phage]|uniref:Uncharacterized protein n=1 Tax=uncultured Caudovirales phage TaxID=2100421 RepID=A0A6J5QGM1_9CAUD|nr:hypothetical protein UFOVP1040_36 [uncultured Caudovirales phage]
MWIFLQNAMLSIVDTKAHAASKAGRYGDRHKANSPTLMVRARLKGDIERVFPGAKVCVTPSADYRYRATVKRERVAEAIQTEVMNIDYGNFKSGVPNGLRHNAYMGVWGVMEGAQRKEANPRTFPGQDDFAFIEGQ